MMFKLDILLCILQCSSLFFRRKLPNERSRSQFDKTGTYSESLDACSLLLCLQRCLCMHSSVAALFQCPGLNVWNPLNSEHLR